jgi:hypothetical protein
MVINRVKMAIARLKTPGISYLATLTDDDPHNYEQVALFTWFDFVFSLTKAFCLKELAGRKRSLKTRIT